MYVIFITVCHIYHGMYIMYVVISGKNDGIDDDRYLRNNGCICGGKEKIIMLAKIPGFSTAQNQKR